MTDRYVIRYICDDDIDQIADLEEKCFSSPMSKENIRAFLLGQNGVSFVCYNTENKENSPVLCAYCGAMLVFDEAQVLNVATHPSYRGIGLGRGVTVALINDLKSKGASCITLEVRESNAVAQGLYDSLGFYRVGRIKNYYKAPVEDGLIMKLDIVSD